MAAMALAPVPCCSSSSPLRHRWSPPRALVAVKFQQHAGCGERKQQRLVCCSTSTQDQVDKAPGSGGDGGDEGDAGHEDDMGAVPVWVSNAPVFLLWAGFVGYAAFGAPNQTPYRDQLFLETLVLLRDMPINPVLVTVFFSMGLIPLMYTMLLVPTGRSDKGGVPVWPFSLVSYFVGAFALLPYFGLWSPPPPPVQKEELTKWPLLVLESKITAVFSVLAAAALVARAALSSGETWAQYFQFFRESKFIHVMSIDFVFLSSLIVFWVYNDMSIRRRSRDSWLPAVSVLPVIGPAIYLLLRPRLPPEMIVASEEE